MGLIPPAQKFDVPNEILGFAMESFSAGRAETKLRHVEVPVAPVDFMSEYPPKPRPAPVISQTLLMAMVPSCIGRLSVFSVYFNNGARNNLRSHLVRSSSAG
jgi:hypothetical protein